MTTTSPSSKVGSSHAPAETGGGTAASKPLEPLMKFPPSLEQAVQSEGPARLVQSRLCGLSQTELALAVVDLLNVNREENELLAVIVTHIWENYVLPRRLWDYYEGGEERFMEAVGYTEFIEPALKSTSESQKRKAQANRSLEAVWGQEWEKVIDPRSNHHSVLPEGYLREMAKLAKRGITLLDAQKVLNHAKKARIARPGRGVRTTNLITVGDIQKVLTAVNSVGSSPDPEYSATRLISTLDAAVTLGTRGTQPPTPEITGPPTPPAILPSSSGASPFSVEVFYDLIFHCPSTTDNR